jgi:acetolactate synthase small subunit
MRSAIAEAGGETISTDADGWRLRLTATPSRIDTALDTLREHGLRRLVRAGAVAMTTQAQPKHGATPS